jgi:hypothetical protein
VQLAQVVLASEQVEQETANRVAQEAAARFKASDEEVETLAKDAGVDPEALEKLHEQRQTLAQATADLAAALAAQSLAADAGDGGARLRRVLADDVAELQAIIYAVGADLKESQATVNRLMGEAMETLVPGSELAGALAAAEVTLATAKADAIAAEAAAQQSASKVQQAEQAKKKADTIAATSEAEASNFEFSASSTAARSTAAIGGSDSGKNGVAGATLLFVLFTIGLLVAIQTNLSRKLAHQHSAVSAMAVSAMAVSAIDTRGSVTTIAQGYRTDTDTDTDTDPDPDTEIYSQWSASKRSLQRTPSESSFQNPAYDGPDPGANEMASDDAAPSHMTYALASATVPHGWTLDLPGQAPAPRQSTYSIVSKEALIVSREASIVSRPSLNGGPPTLAYQMATITDDFEQVSAGLGDLASHRQKHQPMMLQESGAMVRSSVSGDRDSGRDRATSKWGPVRNAIRATSLLVTSPSQRRFSNVTDM